MLEFLSLTSSDLKVSLQLACVIGINLPRVSLSGNEIFCFVIG